MPGFFKGASTRQVGPPTGGSKTGPEKQNNKKKPRTWLGAQSKKEGRGLEKDGGRGLGV